MNEASDPTTSNNLENKYVSFLKENFPELADKTREEVLSVLGDDNGELIQSEPPSSAKAEQYEEILNEAPFDIQDEVNFQSATSVQKFTQNAVTAIETINKMLRVEGKPELDSTLINKRFVEGFLYKGFFRILKDSRGPDQLDKNIDMLKKYFLDEASGLSESDFDFDEVRQVHEKLHASLQEASPNNPNVLRGTSIKDYSRQISKKYHSFSNEIYDVPLDKYKNFEEFIQDDKNKEIMQFILEFFIHAQDFFDYSGRGGKPPLNYKLLKKEGKIDNDFFDTPGGVPKEGFRYGYMANSNTLSNKIYALCNLLGIEKLEAFVRDYAILPWDKEAEDVNKKG